MVSPRQLFLQNLAQTSDFPLMLEVEKAEGVYMYDPQGKKYIDLISGIGVSNVGHRHPKVIKAIKDQLDHYLHLMVYGELIQTPQVKLAQALANSLPDPLNNVYLVNSGSEATEGALKLAKRFSGRAEIFACKKAYHGSTQGALSVGGNEYFKRAFRPLLPGIKFIRFGNVDDLDHISEKTACFILETIQGEAGVRIADAGYFQAVSKKCTQTGTLLILDEIQVGFGRTGKFWAFEHYNIVPDIVLTAKGMGGGMPIGAFIASENTMAVLKNDPILGHISTFGGNAVCAAAGLATLDLIMEENLMEGVENKAQIFKKLLVHPKIKGLRHCGLIMALEFESFEVLKPIIDQALELGVLTDWFLYCDNAMRIAPPLVITEHEINEGCQILLEAIEKAK